MDMIAEESTWRTKVGLAEMLRGGVIMDVTTAEQAARINPCPRPQAAIL